MRDTVEQLGAENCTLVRAGGSKQHPRLRISTLWSSTRRRMPGLPNEWLVDANSGEHGQVMRHTVEQHCAPNCTLVRGACTTCTGNAQPWKQGSTVLCPHMRIVCADTKHSMLGLWQVSRWLEEHGMSRAESLCGQHENVPCANAAAPDSDDDATKPRRAWPHSGYIAATQPRCGVRENRPTRTCTAACRNVGNARDGARTAHRVTRLPGMR